MHAVLGHVTDLAVNGAAFVAIAQTIVSAMHIKDTVGVVVRSWIADAVKDAVKSTSQDEGTK